MEENEVDGGIAKPPVELRRDSVERSEDIPAEQAATNAAQKEIAKLSAALQGSRTESEELKVKNSKLLEEMEGFRLRTERDKEKCTKFAIAEFAGEMLEVADNIRRAINTVPKELMGAVPEIKAFVEGVEVTERALLKALTRHQVTRFDPLGETFNPHLHAAHLKVNVPNVPANSVISVIHLGYMIGERVLRPAAVIVAEGGRAAGQLPESIGNSVAGNVPYTTAKIASGAHAAGDAENNKPAAVHFQQTSSNAQEGRRDARQQGAELQHRPSILHKPITSAAEGIPAATHPIWERLVTGQIKHRFTLFAANMLIDRAKREYANNRGAKARLANELCTFFNRHSNVTTADLATIISATGSILPASHPIWERLVTGQIKHRFTLFAANMFIDRAKREYTNNRGAKTKLAGELCDFFNRHADLTAPELEMIA
ncbi:MAG: nucleotide exchange factor GrpE [Rhodomicrobium sp.]